MKKMITYKISFLFFVFFSYCAVAEIQTDTAEVLDIKDLTKQNIFFNRIQSLEQQLKELKQQIVSSENNLIELKSQIDFSQNIQASVEIQDQDKLGKQYTLIDSIYWIDGKKVAQLTKEDERTSIYAGLLEEGEHQLEVEKLYKRMGSYFSSTEQTFRLKNSATIKTIIGKITHIDVVTFEQDKKSQEKLGIRFDIKILVNESQNVPISVLEIPSSKKLQAKQESYLKIVVNSNANPDLVLNQQIVVIDQQKVETLQPSLVTDKGQIIFEAAIAPGNHTVSSVLRYRVSGKLAELLKTKQIGLKFLDQISVKPGDETVLYLKGYEKDATVILSKENSENLMDKVDDLIRQQS